MNQNEQMRELLEEAQEIISQVAPRHALNGFNERVKQTLAAEPSPTVEPSEDAKHTLANPPERIYLQVGDVDVEFPGEIHWRDVTWCADQIERSDLMYVRSDLVEPAKLVRLTLSQKLEAIELAQKEVLPETINRHHALKVVDAIMDAMQEKNK